MASVNKLIGKLLRKGAREKLFGQAVQPKPAAALRDTYGAISCKVATDKVARHAVELLNQADLYAKSSDPEERQQANAFRDALTDVATALSQSPLEVAPASVLAAFDTHVFMSAVSGADGEIKASLTAAYTANAPLLVDLLDMGLAVGLSEVPVAGPFLAGYVMGGMTGAVQMGAASAVVYAANSNTEAHDVFLPQAEMGYAQPSNSGAEDKVSQGVAKDVAKDMMKSAPGAPSIDAARRQAFADKDKANKVLIAQPRTQVLGLAWYVLLRTKLRWTNEAIASAAQSDGAVFETSSSVNNMWSITPNNTINPQTRNQLSVSSVGKFIDETRFSDKVEELKSRLQTNAETLESFGKKMVEVQKSLRKLLEHVLKVDIVRSFNGDLGEYNKVMHQIDGSVTGRSKFLVEPGEAVSDQSNHTRVVALLIVAYFSLRFSKNLAKANLEAGKPMEKGPPGEEAGAPKKAGDSRIKSLVKEGNVNAIAFKNLQKGANQVHFDEKMKWSTVKANSVAYVRILKSAIVDDLTAPFRVPTRPKDLKDAFKLYMVCAMIVNDNVARKAAKAAGTGWKTVTINSATQIPMPLIQELRKLGFLNLYTATAKFLNEDEKKRSYTAGQTKLRWFDGTVSGASTSEKMMVYVFSCVVLSLVDITKIACGFQNWDETKDLLHTVIREINEAEIQMDAKEQA